ncbi:MAG: hypothetical protein NZ874_04960 [Fimbriimonadales bacterium]|nr:hypothetical protein [Fimbriimonadales bacterium]
MALETLIGINRCALKRLSNKELLKGLVIFYNQVGGLADGSTRYEGVHALDARRQEVVVL